MLIRRTPVKNLVFLEATFVPFCKISLLCQWYLFCCLFFFLTLLFHLHSEKLMVDLYLLVMMLLDSSPIKGNL